MDNSYILLYDADCGICSEAVVWIYKSEYNTMFSIQPYAEFDFSLYPNINIELAQQTVIVINRETGEYFTHGNAILLILFILGGKYRKISKLVRQYKLTPALNAIYKIVAKNRAKISEALGYNSCKIRT